MFAVGEERHGEGNAEEENEPEFNFGVEEGLNLKNQLFGFRKEQPLATDNYRPWEQQSLQVR